MPLDALLLPQPGAGAVRRIGTVAARTSCAKLYASVSAVGGLQPEDLAVAERAWRASIAGPIAAPAAGFAVLRPGCEGGLTFHTHWWAGAELHRTALLLPGCGGPPHRGDSGRVGDVDEVLLMAREAAAWRRWVLDAGAPSLDAYLAECCA